MSITEYMVEDAALEWCGALGYTTAQGPLMAPGETAAERKSFAEVVPLFGQFHETPLPKLLSWEL